MAKNSEQQMVKSWTSPTAKFAFDDLSFTIDPLMTHVEGIRRRGIKEYLKAFVNTWFYDTNESFEEFTNLLSLAIRIFGNIFAGGSHGWIVSPLSKRPSIGIPLPLSNKSNLDCIFGFHFLCSSLCIYIVIF